MKRADKKNQKPKLSFQDDDAEPAFVVKKIKNTFISHSIVSATENNYSQESLKELKSKQKSLPIASPAVDIQDIPEIEIPDSSQILKFKQTRLENRLKETDFFSLTDDQDYEMEPVDYLEDVEMFPDNSGQLINFGDSSIKNANNIAREVMISDINMYIYINIG